MHHRMILVEILKWLLTVLDTSCGNNDRFCQNPTVTLVQIPMKISHIDSNLSKLSRNAIPSEHDHLFPLIPRRKTLAMMEFLFLRKWTAY